MCFFFKQKTAYELRISDWSSDVCSSDLETDLFAAHAGAAVLVQRRQRRTVQPYAAVARQVQPRHQRQQRALARAGCADDGHGFTVRDIEADVLEDHQLAFRQPYPLAQVQDPQRRPMAGFSLRSAPIRQDAASSEGSRPMSMLQTTYAAEIGRAHV